MLKYPEGCWPNRVLLLQITDSSGTDASLKLSQADSQGPVSKPTVKAASKNVEAVQASVGQEAEGEVVRLTAQASHYLILWCRMHVHDY